MRKMIRLMRTSFCKIKLYTVAASNMNKKKNTIFLAVILYQLFLFNNLFGQQVSATIPYELHSGKMIIKMLLNGKEERLIFDTGAGQSSISAEYTALHKLQVVDSMRLNDVTSTSAMYKLTQIASLSTMDKKIGFNGLKPVIMPERSPIIDCFNVVGLIGSDMLQGTVCTIDAATHTITLTDGRYAPKESLRYAHNFSANERLPIFNVVVDGQDLQILMDSGAGEFMVLKEKDAEKLKKSGALQIRKKGKGAKAMGISGEVDNMESAQVYLTEMRVGPAKFTDIITETSNPPYTLLGVKFMEHAKIVIDYPRKRVYYMPYEQVVVKPEFKEANIGITVKDSLLKIAHVWSEWEGVIEEGDVITHIDGVETGRYEFCDVINGIPALRGANPKMLTIKTKSGKIVNLEYKVEIIKV